MTKLSVPDGSLGTAVQAVAAFCGVPCSVTTGSSDITFASADGPCNGFLAVCRQLARQSTKPGVLGADEVQQAQVLEWLLWATSELGRITDDKLLKIHEWLSSRVVLVGRQPTVADVAIMGLLQPAVASLPPAQVNQFCNLLRWYDYLQHTLGLPAAILPLVHIARPAYVAPPPPPPPAPKESAKSDASSSTKGAPAAAAAASTASSKGAPPAPAAAPAAAAAGGKADKKAAKGDASSSGKGAAAAAGGKKVAEEPRIDMIDIRVGKIVKIQQHPNAESLYLEEIDVGEAQPRQIISGLVKFVPVDKMQDRMVVVCCNLKPAKMRDVMSYGMVLCASNADHTVVDPIIPPAGVAIGERITFEGYSAAPLEEVNPKRKILEALFPDLTTDASGTPQYKGVPFMTSAGPVTSTIPNGSVA